MAGVARREARDFHVVAHDVFFGRERVGLAFEESLLEIPARPPTQHLADVQVLAQDVPHHVLRVDALGGLFVVRAAGGVNVMIATPPACGRGIDPAVDFETELLGVRRDGDGAGLRQAFRPAREASERKSLIGTGDRSDRIRTYNFPQGRVTDHRINLTLHKIEQIMDGDLEEISAALASEHQAELLTSFAESA